MEDVSVRIRSGRAVLDSASAWSSSEIRQPTEVAASSQSGQQGELRGPLEKSPEDRSLGSVPFDYGKLVDSGCPPDPRSDEPKVNIKTPPIILDVPQHFLGTLDMEPTDEVKIQETKQQMTTVNPTVSLIKHNQVKALALELMAERFSFNGQPKFTRVSPAFCEAIERFVYTAVRDAIQRHPSTGKTIQDF